MPDIELSSKAEELVDKAQQKRKNLQEKLERQESGDLEEGETQMSVEEMTDAKEEIDNLLDQAAVYEGVDSLEELANRPADDLSDGAKELFAQGGRREGGTEHTDGISEEDLEVFESPSHFLRAMRAMTSDDYDKHQLTKAEAMQLAELRKGATPFLKGNDKREAKNIFKSALEDGEMSAEEIKEQFSEKAITGDSASSGQALVPNVHMSELLRAMAEEQQFVNEARQIPMQRRTVDFPRLDQSGTEERPIFGFAAVTKIGETTQKDEREPSFSQFTLNAVKYAAYLEASDELLDESLIDTEPLLVELLSDAIAYEYDRDGFRGSGSGEPQGYIGSAAEYTVNRQASNDVQTADIFNMEARFFGGDGAWYYHPEVITKLFALADSNIIAWHRDLAADAPGVLLGRELRRSHKLPTLGSKGDLSLVDPQFYVAGNLQQMTVENSIHYQFRNDVTAWRAVFRAAGSPWPAGTFSMEGDGSSSKTYEVSPFVVLDSTVAS